MTNPYRSQRERAAYEAGRAAGLLEAQADAPKPLSREQVQGMSAEQIAGDWDRVQEALTRGLLSQEELDAEREAQEARG